MKYSSMLSKLASMQPGIQRRNLCRIYMESSLKHHPFMSLPDSLLDFTIADTLGMAVDAQSIPLDETRTMIDYQGNIISGLQVGNRVLDEDYHPPLFQVINLKAVWLPSNETQKFGSSHQLDISPIRIFNNEEQVLFFIHPLSELLYRPMIQLYKQNIYEFPAIILSSGRSLLVSVADEKGQHQFQLVKLSLNQQLGINRILSSIDTESAVMIHEELQTKNNFHLDLFGEPFAVLPLPHLLDQDVLHNSLKSKSDSAGMIYRTFPQEFQSEDKKFLLPFFQLQSQKNQAVLQHLLKNRGDISPSQYVVEQILTPMAKLFIHSLYEINLSLEAHAQNLLIWMDHDFKPSGFAYRDMGGINIWKGQDPLNLLCPKVSSAQDIFYNRTHFKDAAFSLEYFWTGRIAFNLTKQFIKLNIEDSHFIQWRHSISDSGYLPNWSSHSETDEHITRLNRDQFYRYGYFESLFGITLLNELHQSGIIEKANYYWMKNHQNTDLQLLLEHLTQSVNPVFKDDFIAKGFDYSLYHSMMNTSLIGKNTMHHMEWFKYLILFTYPFYLSSQMRD